MWGLVWPVIRPLSLLVVLWFPPYPVFCIWQEEEGQQSLECIQANQIFPRNPPVLEEEDLQVRKYTASLCSFTL